MRSAGIELLRLMACSVRDSGVESLFTKGSASGDWQLRQHPSDLTHPPTPCPPPDVDHELGVGATAADDQSLDAASSCDEQARLAAECIASLTASVLRKSGVDEATIADAVHSHSLHIAHSRRLRFI